LNLVTGGLGSAIFSLPWSVAGSSIIASCLIVGIVLCLNGWTISIVVRAAERYNVFDLGGVISHLPWGLGRPLQLITNAFVWAAMFLCLVSYVIVIHDSAETFVKGTWMDSRCLLVGVASACVLPLCFLSQSLLEKTSSLAIAVNVYLFMLVAVLYGEAATNDHLPTGCCLLGSTLRGNFSMASVMFQAVIVQMCVLPMYQELQDRSPQKFDRIVTVAFSTLFFIFCAFSVFGYLLIGPAVSSNILQDLPKGVGGSIAQVGTILVVACVYPIMVYPMIAPILALGSHTILGMSRGMLVAMAKVSIVAAAMITAAFVVKLGDVNVVNGAMSAGVFVALIPSAVGMLLLDVGFVQRLALSVLLVVGLGVSALGLVYKDNYVEDLNCIVGVQVN